MSHLDKYEDIIKRDSVFKRSIGQCNAYDSHNHIYEGYSFEIQPDIDTLTKGTLTGIASTAAGVVFTGGTLVVAGAAIVIASGIIALGTSAHEYTIGVREFDTTVFGYTQTFIQAVVAGDYEADLHLTVPAGTPQPGHPYRL